MGLDNQDDAQFESGYSGQDVPTETPEQKQPEPKAEQKPKSEKQDAPDPMKEVIARIEKFEASQAKLAGHIGGLTRNQEEIKQLLAASKKATENVADAPSQAQVKEAMASPKEWEDLKSEYPEWAAATEKFMDSKLATLKAPQTLDPEAIDKRVEERVAKQTAEDRQDTIDTYLDNIVDGDWSDEVKNPAFTEWLGKQPDDIKALAASNKLRDAAKMLRLYQKSKVQAVKQPESEPKKDSSARQRRFEAAVNPKGTGGHAPGRSDEDDFMAGYNS